MDFNAILQAITMVGFPIVMCCILLWFIKYILDNHNEESKAFTEALNKNTIVLQEVCDLIGKRRGE